MAAPIITSPLFYYGQVGVVFGYKIRARNMPASFNVIGTLPAGLSINTATGLISGTPSVAGNTTIIVTATNTDGTGQASVDCHILAAGVPGFLGPFQTLGEVGVPYSALQSWSNTPTSYSMPSIPAGLSLNTTTGLLSGTPTLVGVNEFIVNATNGTGEGEGMMGITITSLDQIPVINSDLDVPATVGVDFLYQIEATNAPTIYGLSPYLDWMTFSKTTGTIRGKPLSPGDFSIDILAANDAGTGRETLVIHIAAGAGTGDECGGITFAAAKGSLRLVTDNGVDVTDDRVMRRTNEATQEILCEIIPVNGMMAVNVVSTDGGYLLLPKEMENAISVEVYLDGETSYGSTDVRQGWYDIINPFTYVDPSAAHDNPLEDIGLVPDPLDASILRRKYFHRGIVTGTTVHIIGAKRYLPVTTDADCLIVQNLPALKLMIQAIERRENLDITNAKLYKAEALEMLQAEVKKYQLDPRNTMRRKAAWEIDISTYPIDTFGWTRARLALEVPGAQGMGKEEISRLMERAEMLAIEMGTYKGTLEEFDATIYGGLVFLPIRAESMIAISLDGQPIPIRSIFFNYLDNGPGNADTTCGGYVRDLGEQNIGGLQRRQFGISGNCTNGQVMLCICKLRWVPKVPTDYMTIRHLEAIRLLCDSILLQQQEKWNEAKAAKMEAKELLDDQLKEYLSGIQHTLPFTSGSTGFGYTGEEEL